MKKVLMKDAFLEIKNTYKKFLSILLMAFLGVGFFAGIRATSPDMKKTIDNYYNDSSVYDIKIQSTLGLTDDDINALKNIEGIDKDEVYGTYSQDVLINLGEIEVVSKIHAISDKINKVNLLEGNMPVSNNECLVESSFLKFTNKKIGDYIEIDDSDDVFKEDSLKIVGSINSPLYISRDRGTSKLGSGKVNYYMYTLEDNFDLDVYTEIYLKTSDTAGLLTGSNKYENIIQEVKSNIENIKQERENARYNELIDEANNEIIDAEKELEEQKNKALEEFANADKEIADAQEKLNSSENTVKANRSKANKEFADAETKLTQAQAELDNKKNEFENQKAIAGSEIANAKQLLEEQRNNLESTTLLLNSSKTQLENVNNALKDTSNLTQEQIIELQTKKATLEATVAKCEEGILQLNAAIKQIETSISEGENKLAEGATQLEQAQNEINANKNELEKNKSQTYATLNSAEKEIAEGKEELQANINNLNEEKEKYNKEIKEAEDKIIDAKHKVSEIEKGKWYILDRESNSGYSGFMQDTESVANIGKVFPVVFFVIATLISLTSMTRMVEEQRTEIGTLKALGYTNFQIVNKYVLYAGVATIIGGIAGMCVGFIILPKIIWEMYSMMYMIPNFVLEFNLQYAVIGLGAAFLCIVGATIYACVQDLKQVPAALMRPKAPKNGKRVFVERINFIWKRLNFTQKVTVRNIFRYKKRVSMTIIGIMGCTALILAGFGLKDSISKILVYQYEDVFNYSQMLSLKGGLGVEDVENLVSELKAREEINDVVNVNYQSGSLANGNSKEDVQVIVPESKEEIKKVINFVDTKTDNILTLDDETIFVTEKLARLLNVKVGDVVNFEDSNSKQFNLKIGGIVDNYVYHYVYMSKNLYESLGETYETNVLLVNTIELDESSENTLAKELVNDSRTTSITLTSTMMTIMDDTLSSLNYVVWILIVSSGLLAFVVLYNLANVNISERIRELATIKVLGFYDKEVYDYLNRETIILTGIGILLGLVAGYFLTFFIMGTCEINILKFSKEIAPLSYLYAVLITILFTVIVNVATYFALKKIDMIESLKSVE